MKNRVIESLPLKQEIKRCKKKRAERALFVERLFIFLLLVLILSLAGIWLCQEIELSYLRTKLE